MKNGYPSLTVALLMYNEAANIGVTLDETVAFCEETLDDWEIIVVDDGSRDGSAAVVEARVDADPRIRLVSHETNRGMGAGIRSGIEHARKEYFVFNASDGQVAAREIGKLLECLDLGDIVLSTYENMRESAGRELMSRGFRLYLRALAGIRFELQGLYLYPTNTAKVIAPCIDADTFYFSFELIRRGVERGLTVHTTKMRCRPRTHGASKVANLRRIARVGREAARFGFKRWFYFESGPSK
jgi:glycosyltransferase involved in cell wall biosynthesis